MGAVFIFDMDGVIADSLGHLLSQLLHSVERNRAQSSMQ